MFLDVYFYKKLPKHSAASSKIFNLNFFANFMIFSISQGCPNTCTGIIALIILPVFLFMLLLFFKSYYFF